jgi:hypothetical protein
MLSSPAAFVSSRSPCLAVSLALLFCFASPFARARSADTHWPGTLLAGALGVLSLCWRP